MIFVWDTNVLALALHPSAKCDDDPDAPEKVQFMLERISDRKDLIIIPAPVLAEFLVLAGNDGPQYLSKIKASSVFRIESFDERAAIELAEMERSARLSGSKRGSASETAPWQKIKVDRQIVAIARVFGVNSIYSNDPDVVAIASDCKPPVRVTTINGLPLRITSAQRPLISPPDPGPAE